MKLRDYQTTDKPQLLKISLRTWEPVFKGLQTSLSPEIYELFVPDWVAQQTQSINLVCGDTSIDVIVAESEGQISGFSAIKSHPDDSIGEIYMIGVDPDYQRRGVGRALIETSLARIKANGFGLAMVETGGDPGHAPARATYERMGFELWPVARYLKRL